MILHEAPLLLPLLDLDVAVAGGPVLVEEVAILVTATRHISLRLIHNEVALAVELAVDLLIRVCNDHVVLVILRV